jgi:hypothetical protein
VALSAAACAAVGLLAGCAFAAAGVLLLGVVYGGLGRALGLALYCGLCGMAAGALVGGLSAFWGGNPFGPSEVGGRPPSWFRIPRTG